ncbi:MAG: hypothetical protein GY941_19785 [Planctomycetes bacterium]|nr:hypothetical protein [Planctomycetota bacterium]
MEKKKKKKKKKGRGSATRAPVSSAQARHEQMQTCINGELELLDWKPITLHGEKAAGNTRNVWRIKCKSINGGKPVDLPRYGSSNFYTPHNLYHFEDIKVIAQVGFHDDYVTPPVVLFTSYKNKLFPSIGPLYFMPHRSTLHGGGFPASPIAALIHLLDSVNLEAFTMMSNAKWENNKEGKYEREIRFSNQRAKEALFACGAIGKDEASF